MIMREEIEAAALFITRLVNKNLSQSGSIASSIHSHSSSSSSASSSSSESPPDLDEHQNAASAAAASTTNNTANTSSSSTTTLVGTTTIANTTTSSLTTNSVANSSSTTTTNNNGCNGGSTNNTIANDQDKAEQFRQCLEEALYERFHNHWFPDQPTKGQAYRCIRLNEWDRHDTTLQKACSQCGIDYKDLQLPVELTLWVDPEEVTCRFGENKGSHCLVAKFKDGELKDNNFNIDINNIDIEIFHQTAAERTRQQNLHDSPEYHNSSFYAKHLHHNHRMNGNMNNNNNNNNNINNHQQQNNSYHFFQNGNHHHHQSPQHHNHHHQAPQQQTPPHQHRANLGKAPMIPAYHHNYPNGCDTNGNPIYYYF